jgi:hypothetical protein
MALFPWTFLWMYLVSLMSEFRKYRYAEGLSFRETLQELTLYTAEKKFGSTAFLIAVATLVMYWFFNWLVYIMKNPWLDDYHILVVLFVSVASLVVLAVVVGWALDVFTRRLFGEALGKFLFATFVVGAVFHPLLGLLSTFLFSWALFGRAKRRRGGDGDCGAFSIRRNASRSDIDFGVVALVALNNMLLAFDLGSSVLRRGVGCGFGAGGSFRLSSCCACRVCFGCFCLLRLGVTWRRFLSGGGLCRLSWQAP